LLLPALAAFGMYSLVDVQTRYVAPFVVLFWMGLFSGVRLPAARESRRLVECVSIAILAVMLLPIGAGIIHGSPHGSPDHDHWYVATELDLLGRIVAEITTKDADRFWSANEMVRAAAISVFATTGAKVLIAGAPPGWASKIGWQRIRKTDFYAYVLPGR
jgi:hypothetical protein